MTVALLAAAAAAVCAAAALVEWASGRTTPRPSSGPGSRHRDAPARRPVRMAGALARIGRRAGLPIPTPGDLERRLAAAGLPPAIATADVMAVKAGAALVGALTASVLVLPLAPGRLGPVLVVAAPAAGFLAPDWWLRRRGQHRARLLAADLPDVLDLTRVAVASGLPVGRALRTVGQLRGGPLADELRVCSELIELGTPRAQALARLGARCPLPGVLALVAAVGRTERHGTPLAPALAALAADARADRARRVQDRAARAAPKIQLAVALLLVPAAMLLMAAALVAGMA